MGYEIFELAKKFAKKTGHQGMTYDEVSLRQYLIQSGVSGEYKM